MKKFIIAVLPVISMIFVPVVLDAAPTTPTARGATVMPTQMRGPSVRFPAQAAPTAQQLPDSPTPLAPTVSCRDAYRACMDQFCLMDALDGERCGCSDQIFATHNILDEIDALRAYATRIRMDDIEYAQMTVTQRRALAAAAGDGNNNRGGRGGRDSRRAELFATMTIDFSPVAAHAAAMTDEGEALWATAHGFCARYLEACPADADMERVLYRNLIAQNCRDFDRFLADTRRDAYNDRAAARRELRGVRHQMLATTDIMNRGQCLLALRNCISDQGGCGFDFENCLDGRLLDRRFYVCETILDECNAVRTYVISDWRAERNHILEVAAIHSERNQLATCRARIWNCLEESCSVMNNVQCLDDINVARGICPVIDDCAFLISGGNPTTRTGGNAATRASFIAGIQNQLVYMRAGMCTNDLRRCLTDRCGPRFDGPDCAGRSITEIRNLCPRDTMLTCRGISQANFDIIMTSVSWNIDVGLAAACTNYFAEALGRVCGLDMACIGPNQDIINATDIQALTQLTSLTTHTVSTWDRRGVGNDRGSTPMTRGGGNQRIQESQLQAWTRSRVDGIFAQLENTTVAQNCRGAVGEHVFMTARAVAMAHADERVQRQFLSRMTEVARTASDEEARYACEVTLLARLQSMQTDYEPGALVSGAWVVDAHWEPDLRNCRVERRQRVCGEAGMTEGQAALHMAGAGFAGGAAVGTMASPGWGTVIIGAAGAIGGAFAGRAIGGRGDPQCGTINVTENINMGR